MVQAQTVIEVSDWGDFCKRQKERGVKFKTINAKYFLKIKQIVIFVLLSTTSLNTKILVMKQMNVYLNFDGKCEEAIHFYKDAIGGEIISVMRFGDAGMEGVNEMDEAAKQRVMHSEFKSEGVWLMASDSMPGQPVTGSSQVSLNLMFDTEAEQTAVFDKLSAGGQVSMELQDTFWGARFGLCTDKYGINWMFNCDKK